MVSTAGTAFPSRVACLLSGIVFGMLTTGVMFLSLESVVTTSFDFSESMNMVEKTYAHLVSCGSHMEEIWLGVAFCYCVFTVASGSGFSFLSTTTVTTSTKNHAQTSSFDLSLIHRLVKTCILFETGTLVGSTICDYIVGSMIRSKNLSGFTLVESCLLYIFIGNIALRVYDHCSEQMMEETKRKETLDSSYTFYKDLASVETDDDDLREDWGYCSDHTSCSSSSSKSMTSFLDLPSGAGCTAASTTAPRRTRMSTSVQNFLRVSATAA